MIIRGYIEPQILERMVYKKLNSLGITEYDYPINPYKLIENEGIILQEVPLSDENIRGMIVHGPNVSGIMINSKRSYVSKRFIGMHELSHYWFHPHYSKIVCFENYLKEKKVQEWQANNAAAYALMPSKIMYELFEYCRGDIDFMCNYLQVSKDSLVYRIQEMGIQPYKNPIIKPKFNRDSEFIALENSYLYGGL